MDIKQEKFKRLAEKRVNELLDKFRLVGNLADKRNYSYSEDQAKQIVRAVEEEVKTLRSKFLSAEHSEKNFRFRSDRTK
jgi:hypothetical protein